MNQPVAPDEPDVPKPVSDEDVAAPDPLAAADETTLRAAVEYFAADIANLREQSRQADAKASTSLMVVGLMVAAATTVLPRIEGPALGLAAGATGIAVLAGYLFGMVIMPRTPQRVPLPAVGDQITAAVQLIEEPRRLLSEHAHEIHELMEITFVKYRLIRVGLALLGAAFSGAAAAGTVLALI